jgi:phosphoglucosamine mutase
VVRVMVEGADDGVVERHARELAGVVRETLSA